MKNINELYIDIYSRKIIILGALNYLAILLFKIDIFEYIGTKINIIVKDIIYILIGISALYQVTNRDFYLTFLSKAVYPCGSLMEKKPENATIKKTIKTQPNINIIYWAAEYDDKILDPYIAYGKYEIPV